MLKEMVLKSSTVIDSSAALTKAMCKDQKCELEKGIDTFNNFHSSMLQSCSEHSNRLESSALESKSNNENLLKEISFAREATDTVLSTVSNTVGVKRKQLDETVGSLVIDVNIAVTEGCITGILYILSFVIIFYILFFII
jgi:hypothetical protein